MNRRGEGFAGVCSRRFAREGDYSPNAPERPKLAGSGRAGLGCHCADSRRSAADLIPVAPLLQPASAKPPSLTRQLSAWFGPWPTVRARYLTVKGHTSI